MLCAYEKHSKRKYVKKKTDLRRGKITEREDGGGGNYFYQNVRRRTGKRRKEQHRQ